MKRKTLGLYVHIPFCRQKCFYCDFPSMSGQEDLFEAYTRALLAEIAGQSKNFSAYEVDTVFIGGGTPTILPADQLLAICYAIAESFSFSEGYEWTCEANPGTTKDSLLVALKDAGLNRISFGVQSFSDPLLRTIGRIHSAQDATSSVIAAAKAGFTNLSIDLMTGLPGQKLIDLQTTLAKAVQLPLSHISLYSLKIEEGTVFDCWQEQGRLALPDEAEEAKFDAFAPAFLAEKGFSRYEISNYAKPSHACRHNLKYWHYEPYLGLGAAAASFFPGKRWSNETDPKRYIAAIAKGESVIAYEETLDEATAKAEFAFLALRTMRGLDINEYEAIFHTSFFADYGKVFETLANQGLLNHRQTRIFLTDQGKLLGNVVFCAFLP